MSLCFSGVARLAKAESGSGPGDEKLSFTPSPRTEPVTPLPLAATQAVALNRQNNTRVPSALHAQNAEYDVEARCNHVPPARTRAWMVSPFPTSSRPALAAGCSAKTILVISAALLQT